MTFIILLTHWAEMTFHLKDVIYLGGIIFSAAIAYATIASNRKRISKLEKKYDNFKDNFGKLEVQIAKLRFEVVKDVVEEMRKIINNKN